MSDGQRFDPRWQDAVIDQSHWHFHASLYQRYGIVLGPGDFSQIMQHLKKGKARFIEGKQNRTAIYNLRVERLNATIYVLVEKGRLITAWPPSKRVRELKKWWTNQKF